jgi:hypothetical protein
MNAAERQSSCWRRNSLDVEGYSCPTRRRDSLSAKGGRTCWSTGFCVVGLGVGAFGGYFQNGAGSRARVSDSFQPRRLNAQTTSGDVQSRAGVASYCERPERRSVELSVLLRLDRAISCADTTAATLSRDATMHVLWSHSAVHRWCCIESEGTEEECSRKEDRSRQKLPGAIALWGTGLSIGDLTHPHPPEFSAKRDLPVEVHRSMSPPAGERGTVACHVSLAQ